MIDTPPIEPAMTADRWRISLATQCFFRNPHRIAALALYGHPFGFTRDDVGAIEAGVAGIWSMHANRCICDSEQCGCGPEVRALEALAAKIDALLPPEEL